MERIEFAAPDGFTLSGDLYLPKQGPATAVLIGSAMGVKQGFYGPLARAIAARGAAALTFDYRGIGRSRRPGSLRGFAARMRDWGELDLAAALSLLRSRFRRVLFIGHSAGGQLFALGSDKPERALLVASQSGFYGNWDGAGSALMWLFWNAFIPASTAVMGYLPMRVFGQGADVPLGVAREWARWGRHPRYIGSWAGDRMARYTGAVRRCGSWRWPT